MPQPFVWVDVFTESALRGNPLAVFYEAASLTSEQMQDIAREMNLSESTFVTRREGQRVWVRIFTPETELPFAGHPSLGTAAVVHGLDAPISAGEVELQLQGGIVPVRLEPRPFGLRGELLALEAKQQPLLLSSVELVRLLSLNEGDLDPTLPPQLWSSGNPFAFVALRNREAVSRSRCPAVSPAGVLGLVPYALTGERQVHARVFCPGSAVPEDPATGSANAPLATLLNEHGRLLSGETLITTQGVEMRRPSRLEARVERQTDGSRRVWVAGGVVRVGSGRLELF